MSPPRIAPAGGASNRLIVPRAAPRAMPWHGAEANLLFEFVGAVLRTSAYSLLVVFGSEAAIRRYLAWRSRRGARGP